MLIHEPTSVARTERSFQLGLGYSFFSGAKGWRVTWTNMEDGSLLMADLSAVIKEMRLGPAESHAVYQGAHLQSTAELSKIYSPAPYTCLIGSPFRELWIVVEAAQLLSASTAFRWSSVLLTKVQCPSRKIRGEEKGQTSNSLGFVAEQK